MEITLCDHKVGRNSKLPYKPIKVKNGMMMVHVTPKEALALIISLSEQMRTGSPNSGRVETQVYGEGDYIGYFSIAVDDGKCTVPKRVK